MNINFLTENDLVDAISHDWLKPEIPTVILCRNVVDIMRLRIFFHEKFSHPEPATSKTKKAAGGNQPLLFQTSRRKSFFNVHFMTMDQWIQKILPFFESPEKILRGQLAEKCLIFQKLEDLDRVTSPVLYELAALPAFKNEILYLWNLYLWNLQIQPGQLDSPGNNPLSSELFTLFQNVYDHMKHNGYLPLAEIYANEKKNIHTGLCPTKQVICLFSTDYNIIERIKMNFLVRNHPCQWRFVFNDDYDRKNSTRDNVMASLKTRQEITQTCTLRNFANTESTYENWLVSNRDFFQPESSRQEMKIRMCKNIHAEFHLLAQSIRRLYDGGTPLHSLFILYGSARELPLLEYYLGEFGIRLNHPEKFAASTRSVVSIAADLVDLLGLRDKPGAPGQALTRNQAIELFLNPVFYLPGLEDLQAAKEETGNYIYENFEITSGINLEILRNKSSIARLPLPVKRLVEILAKDQAGLRVKKLPSDHSKEFMNLLLGKIPGHDAGLPSYLSLSKEHLDDQTEAIRKVVESFFVLDRHFPGGMEPTFYYALLYDELSGIKMKSSKPPRSIEPGGEFPEVYARNIQEGVHSPVDYLFICNLTSKAFPSQDRHPDFLEASGEGIEFTLNLNAGRQKQKLRNCLALVRRGYCMTFNLQQDPAPSEFVFEQIPVKPGEKIKKEKLLNDLPFYERRGDEGKPGMTGPGMAPSFLAKMVFAANKPEQPDHREYTGLFTPVENKKVSSSGAVERFSWCPQYFWFDKKMRLLPPENYYDERFIERRHSGTLFHEAAKNLVRGLLDNFYGLEYGKIRKGVGAGNLEKLLCDSFEKAGESVFIDHKTDFEIFREGVLNRAFGEFRDYFYKFFHLSEKGRHPLYDYHPLAVELAFEDIPLGPFMFRGRIDRIDYHAQTRTACVSDYKTGSAKNPSCNVADIKSLGKFQLPLYIKAVSDIVSQNVAPWKENFETIRGAYEFTKDPGKSKTLYFMEITEGETLYPLFSIGEELESLLKKSLNILAEVLASGYFFAWGHKKTPDGEWEPGCSYCDYSRICDRSPYPAMIRRLDATPLAAKLRETLSPAP